MVESFGAGHQETIGEVSKQTIKILSHGQVGTGIFHKVGIGTRVEI